MSIRSGRRSRRGDRNFSPAETPTDQPKGISMKPLPLKAAGGKRAVPAGGGVGHLSPLRAFRSLDRPGRRSLRGLVSLALAARRASSCKLHVVKSNNTHGKEDPRRNSGRYRYRWAALGADARASSVVRDRVAGGFGPVGGQGLRRGGTLANEDGDALARSRYDGIGSGARGGAEGHVCCARCRDCGGTGAAFRRGRVRGDHQFERAADEERCAAGDSGSECGSREAHRVSECEASFRRLCRHQSELLGDRTGAGAGSIAAALRPGDGDGGDHAGGQWSRISGSSVARHSGKRDSLHRQRRREDGGRDAQAAGAAERERNRAGRVPHERAVQPGGGRGWAYGIGVGETGEEGGGGGDGGGVERVPWRAAGDEVADGSGAPAALRGGGGSSAAAV